MWVLGVPVFLFIVLLVSGLTMSDKDSAKWSKVNAIDRECDKMMSDSAPGNERRMTRQMCDQMKASAKQ